jgi:ubiquinone/menaquinone biosynthesis C-methylase UbiE
MLTSRHTPSSVATLGQGDNVRGQGAELPRANMEAALGVYVEHVVPRIMNVACGSKHSRPLRERVCAGLHGQVVEIGFGSGHNVPFNPDPVQRVAAIEPSQLSWKLARDRVSASAVTVERAGLDGQSLAFADNTIDTALSTWTLCTIPDPALALTEVHRVLRPGGACTSSSMAWRQTRTCSAGSAGSSRSTSG